MRTAPGRMPSRAATSSPLSPSIAARDRMTRSSGESPRMDKEPLRIGINVMEAPAIDPPGKVEIASEAVVGKLHTRKDALDSEAHLPADWSVLKRSTTLDECDKSLKEFHDLTRLPLQVIVNCSRIAHVLLIRAGKPAPTHRMDLLT